MHTHVIIFVLPFQVGRVRLQLYTCTQWHKHT